MFLFGAGAGVSKASGVAEVVQNMLFESPAAKSEKKKIVKKGQSGGKIE